MTEDSNKSGDEVSESVEEQEYSGYNIHDSSIANIFELQNKILIRHIRIMHSETLQSMIGLSKFNRLEEVNLSSNGILRIEGLDGLNNLKTLNLSCNKLTELSGLSSLFRLEKLIVSHNKINTIAGLQQMSGQNYNIKSIDLKNNKITNVNQLQFLQDLNKLQELTLQIGNNSNPICTQNPSIYYQGLVAMRNFSRIIRIDGQTPDNIIESLRNFTQNQNYNQSNNYNQNQNLNGLRHAATILNAGQGRGISSGDQTNPKGAQFINPSNPNQKTSIQNGMSNEQSAQKQFSYGVSADQLDNQKWKGDHLQMQQDLQQALLIQKELINKYEVNDTFWESKYQKLQEEFAALQEDNRQKNQRIKVMTKEKAFLEEQISEVKNERIRMLNKTEKREDIVETLQLRITDLIKENGQYHRELAIRADQMDKQTSEIKNLREELIEMRGRLRENEQTLSEFHRKALEQANTNLTRNEEIRQKYELVLNENKLIGNENGVLKTRVQELLEITREWEYKYEKKMDELNYKKDQYVRDMEQEFAMREQQTEKQMREWEKAKEDEFKENVELMEQEFKKYFFENNKRFRELSLAYEEKCKQESDSRHLMKVAVQKNSDQAVLIEELQTTLLKIKKEVAEIINERDIAQKELDTKKSTYVREVSGLEEERDRLVHDKMSLDRQFQDLQERHMTENLELERLRARMKYFDNIEEDIETYKEKIDAKNIMLEDKNETIEDLKAQLDGSRQREQQLNDDFNKLQKKYDKQNLIIEELDMRVHQANEEAEQSQIEYNNLWKEFEQKKQIIQHFSAEIDDIKSKQDKEKSEKDSKIQGLLNLLDECKQSIRRKEEQIIDLQEEIKERNAKFEVQIISFNNDIKQREKIIKELQAKNEEFQDDMKKLLIEYEKSQKQAEAYQKLQSFFKQ